MKSLIAPLLLLAAGAVALGQKTPAPTKPTTGTTNPSNFPSNNTPSTNSTVLSMPRPIYLSGKVTLQDGTPPPEPVRVERICSGNPRLQGYTDTKGRFQFQMDGMPQVDEDAADPGPRSAPSAARIASGGTVRTALMGCDLRATLPGFVSSSISLANHSTFDNPDVGVIVLRRLGTVEGTTISMSSLNAPKDALKAYEKGRELLKKEKEAEAERSFRKAVDLYPAYATAWFNLGLIQVKGHPADAEASFRKAIEADPKFISPYLSLDLMMVKANHWDRALELSDTIVKLNAADFPQAYFFRAVAQFNLRGSDAEKNVRKALELDTRHDLPQAEKLLGVILASRSDFAGGAEHLHRYLDLAPNASDATQVRAQISEMEKQAVAAKQPQ